MLRFRFRRHYQAKALTLSRLLPSIITLLGLAIGLTALKLSLEGRWELAVSCIVVAAFIDGIDGRIARILNATSRFGAELDSLCDFANFGIVPGLTLYFWSLRDYKLKSLGWSAVLLFTICIAIRLARFNTNLLSDPASRLSKHFFRGVPSPIAAILVLMPLILDFDLAMDFDIQIKDYRLTFIIYTMLIGFISASRLPTFSIKHLKVRHEYIWILLLSFAVLIISILLYPWYIIPMMNILYLISIPVSMYIAKRIKN